MTRKIKPPFRAEHLGSLIRPPRLRAARESWMQGRLAKDELKRVEDECIIEAVAMQERIGMPSISDGEFRREHWNEGFLRACDGFSTEQVKTSFNFRDHGAGGRAGARGAAAECRIRQAVR